MGTKIAQLVQCIQVDHINGQSNECKCISIKLDDL
jgi:hypothetical protein